jgi:hypothetical protein
MRANASFLRRFGRLSGANKRVLAEALISLVAASLAVRTLPFRRVAAWMGAGRGAGADADIGEAAAARIVNQCAWAVRSWAVRVPWRAVCFQRGPGASPDAAPARHCVAAPLRRRPGRQGLRAHVWVTAGGRTVMGGEEAPGFTCLATFPAAD